MNLVLGINSLSTEIKQNFEFQIKEFEKYQRVKPKLQFLKMQLMIVSCVAISLLSIVNGAAVPPSSDASLEDLLDSLVNQTTLDELNAYFGNNSDSLNQFLDEFERYVSSYGDRAVEDANDIMNKVVQDEKEAKAKAEH